MLQEFVPHVYVYFHLLTRWWIGENKDITMRRISATFAELNIANF